MLLVILMYFVVIQFVKRDVTRKVILNVVPAPLPVHPLVIGDAPLCRANR